MAIARQVGSKGKVLGIERDREVLEKLKEMSLPNIILVQGNFGDLKKIARENDFFPVQGILFDLGMSSWQIEKSGRGFSFRKDEPLDMRYDSSGLTAEEIVNQWTKEDLEKIFREYGEERYGRLIARAICQVRRIKPIKRTGQLVEVIGQAVPGKYKRQRLHFATRVFQALRIAVNDELNNFKKSLPQALEILEKNGRLAIISFHSLEDRIVKIFFRQQAKEGNLKILFKKPVRPGPEEIESNPRSRSAKLRLAIKV